VGRLTALCLAKKKPYTWGDSEEKPRPLWTSAPDNTNPKPTTVNLKAIHLVNEGSYLVTRDYRHMPDRATVFRLRQVVEAAKASQA